MIRPVEGYVVSLPKYSFIASLDSLKLERSASPFGLRT
jgi:hypothetical protein